VGVGALALQHQQRLADLDRRSLRLGQHGGHRATLSASVAASSTAAAVSDEVEKQRRDDDRDHDQGDA
jgi:hypothetical protein